MYKKSHNWVSKLNSKNKLIKLHILKSKTKPQNLTRVKIKSQHRCGLKMENQKHTENMMRIYTYKALSKWMNTSVHKYKPLVIASDWMKNHWRRNLHVELNPRSKKLSTTWTRNEKWSIWNNYTCTEISLSKYMYNWTQWLFAFLDGFSSTGVHFYQNLFLN